MSASSGDAETAPHDEPDPHSTERDEPDERSEGRFGRPGGPVNRGNPFYLGFIGALGVFVAWSLAGVVVRLSSVFTLIVVAMFLALGLDPVVQALQRRGLRRGWAVTGVLVGVVAVFVSFVAAVVPPLVTQATELATALPDLLDQLLKSSIVRRLDDQYGVISKASKELQTRLSSGQTVAQLFGGVFGAGKAVLSGFVSAVTVLVLTLYFLASLRKITDLGYRIVPASRRARVRLLGDEIIRRIGGYVAGQVTIASINAVCTFIVVKILGLPYGLVLAISVGLFGLIPLVGATIGAVIVVLVALFHSWQYGVVVAVYYLIYQQVENYVIAPRIMSRTVAVPGAVALISALAGATLLGVLGALIAIPVAAGVLLIINEVLLPRQEAH